MSRRGNKILFPRRSEIARLHGEAQNSEYLGGDGVYDSLKFGLKIAKNALSSAFSSL